MSTAAPASVPKLSLHAAVLQEQRRLQPIAAKLADLREQRDDMRGEVSRLDGLRLAAQARVKRLRDDPQALLVTTESEFLEAEAAERRSIRVHTNAQNLLRSFEARHPNLDVQLAQFENDKRALEMGRQITALQPLAVAMLKSGDAYAKACTELHASLLPLLEKFPMTNLQMGQAVLPSRRQLLDLEWPEGFFVRPPGLADGRERVALYDLLRIALASVFPELFVMDDPALGPPPTVVPRISEDGVIW